MLNHATLVLGITLVKVGRFSKLFTFRFSKKFAIKDGLCHVSRDILQMLLYVYNLQWNCPEVALRDVYSTVHWSVALLMMRSTEPYHNVSLCTSWIFLRWIRCYIAVQTFAVHWVFGSQTWWNKRGCLAFLKIEIRDTDTKAVRTQLADTLFC